MSTKKLSNITIKQYRKFLVNAGCKHVRTTGGHEHWVRTDLFRPITFQTHIDPVPEFIIKQVLRTMGISKKQFWEILEE